MTNNATRIANLSPEQRERLRQRLKEKSGGAKKAAIQPQARNTAVFPMSFAQQRLWFLEQLEPGTAVHNIPVAVRLLGPLEEEALVRSFNDLAQRHEALRTYFDTVEGEPQQIIQPARSVSLTTVDLRHLPEPKRAAEAQRLATTAAQQPFDLRQGPLWRVTLYRLAETEHLMLLTLHHIIADGWSLEVLFRELSLLYRGHVSKLSTQLPSLPIQYADYAVWQQATLRGETLAHHLARWQQQAGETLPDLELPTDYTRPPRQSIAGANEGTTLPIPLSNALKRLSRQEEVTLFMTLLAAFKVLLHRYTGQHDIVVGSPIANRNRREIEGLIGFFVNTLVLRTTLDGRSTFREVLHQVRETTLAAYSHQDLPFEKLVEALRPERDLSRPPLVQVMFTLQNAPRESLNLPGVRSESVAVHTHTTKFDLALSINETADTLIASIEYNTELFEAETIRRMVGHFQTLLAGIVANPDQRLSALPLLTAAERQQILVDWNDTQANYPHDQCIHHLFETQAARTPQAIAVTFENEQLTYRELNRRANQLAHYLQKQGVGPDVPVGICLERSLEMMIGVLGILKAGGAYVPLDPIFPAPRVAFMLSDAQAQVLVTQQHLVDSVSPSQAHVVCLDREGDVISRQSTEAPDRQVLPENLAYIIYTSGSTGQPKGVEIPHRAVINFLHTMSRRPGLTAQDRLLAVTTLSFDIAGLELFLPLLVGAQVELVSSQGARDGRRLAEKLVESGATFMQATPATWQLLLDSGWEGADRLKILCGGEALSRDLANQLLEKTGSVWNMYGPTETTIWSTCLRVEPGEDPVSLGRPIANTQIYILDPQLQPVPIGVPGELHIGGDGLARGYRNRPKLTAEKFIENPFSNRPGARLYKTGDLARYLPDGNIEFLGRIDTQLKMRGFRIEPGEIEAALQAHSAVQSAVVLAREDKPGQKRLVAYILLEGEQGPSSDQLRRFLKQTLPSYMIPTAFVVLEAWPLTPNGKIDRQALPPPDRGERDREEVFIPPRTFTERKVAAIWMELLGLEQVGVQENFFQLGGHSLLAGQVISRLWDTFDVKLQLHTLFTNQTIADLAEFIEASLKETSHQADQKEHLQDLVKLLGEF